MSAQTIESGRRYVASPARFERVPVSIPATQWDALGIPVGLAFFFFNSTLGRVVAFYPGPAGATQSLLPMEAWAAVASGNPVIRELTPDVEALLVRRVNDVYVCFVVPIDACYELVGRIRAEWTGFSGGDRVHAEIDSFFDALGQRGPQ